MHTLNPHQRIVSEEYQTYPSHYPYQRIRQDTVYQELEKRGYCPEIMPLILSREEASRTVPLYFDMVEDGIILYDDGTMQHKLEEVRERMRVLGSRRIVLDDGSWYWDLKPDLKPGEVFEI